MAVATTSTKVAKTRVPAKKSSTKGKKTETPAKPTATHPSWKAIIKECISEHASESRSGVSRQMIKKFAEEKYNVEMNGLQTSQLNRAIASGADGGLFVLPKGPAGKVKLSPKSKPLAPKENTQPATIVKKTVKEVPTKPKVAPKKKAVTKPPTVPKKTSTARTEAKKAAAKASAKKASTTKAAATKSKTAPRTKSKKAAAA